MKLGEQGIGAFVSRQGMEVGPRGVELGGGNVAGPGIDYDRVEIVVNKDGLNVLLGDLGYLFHDCPSGGEATMPLRRRNGIPVVLRIALDPKAEVEP